MAFDYTEMVDTALELIAEFGAPVILKDEEGMTKAKTMGVKVSNASDHQSNPTSAGGSVIQASNDTKTVLIPGTIKAVPQIGWTMTLAKETFRVVTVEATKPANVTIYYTLQVTS